MLNSVFSYSNGCAIPPSSGKYFAENSFLPGLLEDMKINELWKPKWKQTRTWSWRSLFKAWPQISNIFRQMH